MPDIAVEIGNVGRIIARQAKRAYLLGEAQTPVVLHGAGLRGISRREARGRSLLLEHDDWNAAAAELDGEHQSARPRSDDDDGAVPLAGHAPA